LSAHLANLALHVAAGIAGISLGFLTLARAKGTVAHRRLGRRFGFAALLVIASSFVGLIAFRFLPLFAVLALLVLYQLVGGWRAARTRELGPGVFDAVWTLLVSAVAILLVPLLTASHRGPPVVLYSSLGALALTISWDALRWAFPRRWFARLWRFEHSYKMVSSIFAMLSAFVGNVIRFGQPWSQLLPSVAGVLVIAYFFVRLSRDPARLSSPASA
jgi:uncharacterized membrane protein